MIAGFDAIATGTDIQRRIGVKTSRDEPLARFTTMRVGGPADLFATIHNAHELRRSRSRAAAAAAAPNSASSPASASRAFCSIPAIQGSFHHAVPGTVAAAVMSSNGRSTTVMCGGPAPIADAASFLTASMRSAGIGLPEALLTSTATLIAFSVHDGCSKYWTVRSMS